eukprot:scaffold141278_cov220-Phaeocystis_antarctica.AAC.1
MCDLGSATRPLYFWSGRLLHPPAVQRNALRRGDTQPVFQSVRNEYRVQQQPASRDARCLAAR